MVETVVTAVMVVTAETVAKVVRVAMAVLDLQ